MRSSINDGFTFSGDWQPWADMEADEHTEQAATKPHFPGLKVQERNSALLWRWRLLRPFYFYFIIIIIIIIIFKHVNAGFML